MDPEGFNLDEYCVFEEDDTALPTVSQTNGGIHPVGSSHSGPSNSESEICELALAVRSGGGTTGGEVSRGPTKRAAGGRRGGGERRKR